MEIPLIMNFYPFMEYVPWARLLHVPPLILTLTLRWTHYGPYLIAGPMVALQGAGWSWEALLAPPSSPCPGWGWSVGCGKPDVIFLSLLRARLYFFSPRIKVPYLFIYF